jgi:hypothetical protein
VIEGACGGEVADPGVGHGSYLRFMPSSLLSSYSMPYITKSTDIIDVPEAYLQGYTAFDCLLHWPPSHPRTLVKWCLTYEVAVCRCHSARQGIVFGDTAPLCNSTSSILVAIGILTPGFSASCYVFRDGLCISAPAM